MTDYTVALEDVLGQNYTITQLHVSDCNPTIDSDIIVTVTLEDVYEDPVASESITITATAGTFTTVNGTSITAAATATGTTDSNGQVTLTYNCSEWGLITFTSGNVSTQVLVDGWRLLSGYTEQSSFRFYRNKTHAKMILNGWGNTITFTSTWTQFGNSAYAATIKPQKYVVGINSWGNVFFRINTDGTIDHRAISSNVSNINNYMQLEWAIQQ